MIKKEKENPFNTCYEKWRKNVYLNHPYAFNTIGNKDNILNITYENILSEFKNFKRRQKYLISNNLVIKGENLESVDTNILKEKTSLTYIDLNQNDRFVYSSNDINQTIIMIGNQTCSCKSNEYLKLKVLESYLSYGMSSVLFKLFREKNGITYDLGVHYPLREQNAPFLVYLSVSNKNALIAFNLLSKLWRNLLLNKLSDNEIFLAKEKLKSSYLFANQSLDEILQRKIQLISYGISPNTEENINSKIDVISSKDILQVINKYFCKPFLSISSQKKICSQIKVKWNETL